MQFLHPGPASQNGFHLTSHRQLETDEIQPHVRQEKETSEDSDSSPPYLPTQPSAPHEADPYEHHTVQSYVRDVAV